MLTRFGVDPDAVLSATEAEHRRLLRCWIRYGVLCHDDERFEKSELFSAIETLPQSVRHHWKRMLKTAWLKPVSNQWPGWRGVEDRPESVTVLNGRLDLACLEETRLELVQNDLARISPKLETSLLGEIDNSAAFLASEELANKRTDRINVHDLWKERFARPAALVRNITIVDRYALADGESINGLEAFFVLLDGSAKKTNVTLFSSFGDERMNLSEDQAQNRMVAIRMRLARGGVEDIRLFLTDSRNFGRTEHDRFIKFDHLVFEIGAGMAVFNGRQAKQSTFSAKLEQDGHRKTLKNLRSRCPTSYPVFV